MMRLVITDQKRKNRATAVLRDVHKLAVFLQDKRGVWFEMYGEHCSPRQRKTVTRRLTARAKARMEYFKPYKIRTVYSGGYLEIQACWLHPPDCYIDCSW